MFWFLIYRRDSQDLKAACRAESDEDALQYASDALNVPVSELECIPHERAKELAQSEHLPVIE